MKRKMRESKKGIGGSEIFLFAYILLIILPCTYLVTQDAVAAIVNVLLSVGLIGLLLYYYFDKTYYMATVWGFGSIFETQSQERYFMDFHRSHFWENTDLIITFEIKNFLRDRIHEMAVMARMGSKLRILMLDPQSDYVRGIEKSAGMVSGEYAYYVLQVQNFAQQIAQESVDKTTVDMEIKFYDSLPLDNLFCAGDVVFAYNNKQTVDGTVMSCSYEKGYAGYAFYTALFEEKWNDGSFSYQKEITADMIPNLRIHAMNDTISYKI